jgi:hypothetical protein
VTVAGSLDNHLLELLAGRDRLGTPRLGNDNGNLPFFPALLHRGLRRFQKSRFVLDEHGLSLIEGIFCRCACGTRQGSKDKESLYRSAWEERNHEDFGRWRVM